jgi:uncharacterized membrane protein YbaN (DUF454 family)
MLTEGTVKHLIWINAGCLITVLGAIGAWLHVPLRFAGLGGLMLTGASVLGNVFILPPVLLTTVAAVLVAVLREAPPPKSREELLEERLAGGGAAKPAVVKPAKARAAAGARKKV